MNSQESMDCLEAVDDLINRTQRRYDDLLWSAAGMTYGDQAGGDTLESYPKGLSGILLQLDYLYSLREQGVLYKPNF